MSVILDCPDCENDMEVYDEKTTRESFDDCISVDGDTGIVWNPKDCKNFTFHVCEECAILQVTCNKCNEPMELTGHMGFGSNGIEHMRNSKTKTKVQMAVGKPIKDKNVPRFDIIDLHQNKIRLNDWMPCGPEYDHYHFWYCPNCEIDAKFTKGTL